MCYKRFLPRVRDIMAEMSGGMSVNDDGSPAGGSGPVSRMNEFGPERTHENGRSNKPSEDTGHTADQADSLLEDNNSSLMDGNPNATTEPHTADADRHDSGYTVDSTNLNADATTNVATRSLPSNSLTEASPSSGHAPSSNQPSDRHIIGSNGPPDEQAEDPSRGMEETSAVEIADHDAIAASLTDDDDETDSMGDLQQSWQLQEGETLSLADEDEDESSGTRVPDDYSPHIQNWLPLEESNGPLLLPRIDASGLSMAMAVGPPLYHVPWRYREVQEAEYTRNLPSDMVDFIDLRLATEAAAAAGNEERQPIEPVEESLESRRQSFIRGLPEKRVVVHHNDLVEDILKFYDEYPNIHKTHKLYVRFLDDQGSFEDGIDAFGMTKAMISDSFRCLPFKFPYLHVLVSPGPPVGTCPQDCKCEVLAKLIFHGYILTAQLPKFLPRVTVMRMFCSPAQFTDNFAKLMIATFVNRQVPLVQAALKRAMEIGIQNDEDMADMCEFANSYGDGTTPPKEPCQFKKWFRTLVLDACVNNPNHFVATFSKFREEKLGYSVPADVKKILETLSPTREDILNLLKPAFPENWIAFEFLISFLSTCKIDLVLDFLQFCTGSDNLTMDEIKVRFYKGKGFPEAHTCFNTVSIPTGYDRYEDFEERMVDCLENKDNYQFHRQ